MSILSECVMLDTAWYRELHIESPCCKVPSYIKLVLQCFRCMCGVYVNVLDQ